MCCFPAAWFARESSSIVGDVHSDLSDFWGLRSDSIFLVPFGFLVVQCYPCSSYSTFLTRFVVMTLFFLLIEDEGRAACFWIPFAAPRAGLACPHELQWPTSGDDAPTPPYQTLDIQTARGRRQQPPVGRESLGMRPFGRISGLPPSAAKHHYVVSKTALFNLTRKIRAEIGLCFVLRERIELGARMKA